MPSLTAMGNGLTSRGCASVRKGTPSRILRTMVNEERKGDSPDALDQWVRLVGLLQLVALEPGAEARLLTGDSRGADHRGSDLAFAADDARAIGHQLHDAGYLDEARYLAVS